MRKDKNKQRESKEQKSDRKELITSGKLREKLILRRNVEEDRTENDNGQAEKTYRSHKAVLLIMAGIVVMAVLFLTVSSSGYNSYEVVKETSVNSASMTDYVQYQNALLKYSKDGVEYIDGKGQTVWNETFAMKVPDADVSGEYAAIADLNGNDVYVFNTKGKVSATTMPYKVCDVAVASQGEFAVILEGEKENYINIYDKNGEPISEIQTTLDKSGYPMDVDLSNDGKKLFSTYLYLDGAEVKNGLAAYNFGTVGQNENADRLMGGYQLKDTIVPKVEFLDNNTICAFGDNQFIIYSMREKPSEKAKIVFDEEVRSVVYNSDYIGIVIYNNKAEEKVPYLLELYNTSGKKVLTKNIDFNYENVRMSRDEIVFTGGTECRIYTVKGRLKFSYIFQRNVVDIVPTGYKRRYIVLYESGSEVIRLKHESEKD